MTDMVWVRCFESRDCFFVLSFLFSNEWNMCHTSHGDVIVKVRGAGNTRAEVLWKEQGERRGFQFTCRPRRGEIFHWTKSTSSSSCVSFLGSLFFVQRKSCLNFWTQRRRLSLTCICFSHENCLCVDCTRMNEETPETFYLSFTPLPAVGTEENPRRRRGGKKRREKMKEKTGNAERKKTRSEESSRQFFSFSFSVLILKTTLLALLDFPSDRSLRLLQLDFSFSLLPVIRKKKKCVRGVLFSLYFLSLSSLLLLHPSSPLVLSFFSARVRFLSEYVYSKVFSPALSLFS